MIRASRELRVCVLAGGDSAERTISLASGQGVARALATAGYQVVCIDPRPPECPPTPRPAARSLAPHRAIANSGPPPGS